MGGAPDHRNPRTRIRSRLGRLIYRLLHGEILRRESDPVRPREWLLRRVPSGNPSYFDRSLDVPLQALAFAPSKERDWDGLSFFRESFVSPRDLAMFATRKTPYVFRLRAQDLIALELTLNPTPNPAQPPGHVSVPELGAEAKRRNKGKVAALQADLVPLALLAFDPNR